MVLEFLYILNMVLLPTVVVVMGCVIARAIRKPPQLKYTKLDFSEKE